MVSVKYFLICATCILMVTPSDAWFAREFVKFFKEDIPQTFNKIKTPLCKGFFGVACPVGLNAAAGAITVGTAGAGAAVWGGAAAGSIACVVAKDEACKRNLGGNTVILPFSDNFDDFDKNHDGFITLKEFIGAVISTINLEDPEDLIEPFDDSDTDDDGRLDKSEFAKSEFLFPAENNKRTMNPGGNTVVLPFSDNFSDYDKNDDGYITFFEFVKAVESSVNLEDPLDLLQPFSISDANDDGLLEQSEFVNSDFLFPGKLYMQKKSGKKRILHVADVKIEKL